MTEIGIDQQGPVLPQERGKLSAAILGYLGGQASLSSATDVPPEDLNPYGDDLQLALYVCYELHYRGFAGVSPSFEWDPALLSLRSRLEHQFLTTLRKDARRHETVDAALAGLLVEPVQGTSVSHFLQDKGELWQLNEFAAQRSAYHLKEADPQVWVLPRLWGRAKAGMAAVEFDEYGGGRAERVHAQLFADLMKDLGLDTTYGHYVDDTAAPMLATVNLMSLFGLHRVLRGCLVGHFAAVEVTSSPGSRRLAEAMRRTGAGPAAEFFYSEHVEADAVHEQIVRREVIGGLLEEEPHLEADIAFGIDATVHLEDLLGDHLLDAWRDSRTSLYVSGQAEGS
ncbi:iron-containing redox enzyme family protein [Streptomyces sp. NBC_00322]|uniref:iron-containing redox enzyme family protein n=1 Tax=Streptomyces sp. NBC_00322 TaxID=2975712 RepID=UPI002E281C56|nr:iron-containing redox enzyme family protein [Streptomyces sp. NBC_00322]